MKITVEVSEKDLRDVRRFSGHKKKGPAVVKILQEALMLYRRHEVTGKFKSGKWSIEFPYYEEQKRIDRNREAKRLSKAAG